MTSNWTAEEDETLTKRWNLGHTAREIAIETSDPKRSRSAVLGRAMRLGLFRREETRTMVRRLEVKRSNEIAPPPKAPLVEKPPLIVSPPRPWMTRKYGECAYPIEQDGEIMSCCAPVRKERNYCKAHCRIMFVKASK